jgi:WD40 repeat protein
VCEAREWLHIAGVNFSPDGGLLAACERGGELDVWDTQTGQKRLIAQPGAVDARHVACRFSPDAGTLIYADGEALTLWDLSTRCPQFGVQGMIGALTFSADGRRFAVWGWDGDSTLRVQLWERCDRKPPWRLVREHRYPGHRLLGITRTVRLPIGNLTQDADPSAKVAFSPDLKTFAHAEQDREVGAGAVVHLRDLETGAERARLLPEEAQTVITGLSFRAGGDLLAVSSGGGAWLYQSKITLWDLRHSPPRRVGAFPNRSENAPALSPDASLLVVGTLEGVDLLDVETGQTRAHLSDPSDCRTRYAGYMGPPGPPTCLTFSRDGSLALVTGLVHSPDPDGWLMQHIRPRLPWKDTRYFGPMARLWDVSSGRQLQAFDHCAEAQLSPDGSTVAVRRDDDGSVQLWDVPPGTPPGRIACWVVLAGVVTLLGGRCLIRNRHALASHEGDSVA